MDYEKLLMRGHAYMKRSGFIWYTRTNSFISVWANMHDGRMRERLAVVIKELETRVNMSGRIIIQLEEIKKQKDIAAGNTLIYLECPKFKCRYGDGAVGTAVKYSEYEEGKYTCQTCGNKLVIREEMEIKKTLKTLGIDFG